MQPDKDDELQPGEADQSLTPHELIQRHIDHPDEPITDADIRNLKLGGDTIAETTTTASADAAPLPAEEKSAADDLADELEKDNTGMSYQADM